MQRNFWQLRAGCAVLLLACGCQREVPRYSLKEPFLIVRTPQGKLCIDAMDLTRDERAAVAKLDRAALDGILTVRVAGAADDAPNVAGAVALIDSGLRFEPRYPLAPGVRYRVVLHRSRIAGNNVRAEDLVGEVAIRQSPPKRPTSVAQIYPTADGLPENLLKFYIHFSAPMSRGEAYRRVHLLDAAGREVTEAFLELGEELWDPGLRRFTLLFDPGRVKRGLKPREEVGPVLEEGRRYTLVVDRQWLDAAGRPLAAETRKSFDVLAPDDEPVDTRLWKIEPPKRGSTDPLAVRFGEPLDHSMLARVIRVVGPTGEPVAGSIEIADGETLWRFTPPEPWAGGNYQLVADTTLEDVAGNSIGRAFDVDVVETTGQRITTETISIPFTIGEHSVRVGER